MSTTETPQNIETPHAVVSSQQQAPTATTVGGAVKEAQQRKTKSKNQSRTTRSGGVRYIPGQSCIQLGQKHDFIRKTARGGREYDVCQKCGSSKMVPLETKEKTASTKRNSGKTGASSNASSTMACLAFFTANASGKMLRCDRPANHEGKHSQAGVE